MNKHIPMKITVGEYLAKRLNELGLKDYFAIPGDYNLTLLDQLLKIKALKATYCCNELNAGYAADGYARAHGLAAAFVTYSVGGLSIINAAAGAYAEDLPIIFVSGSPNTNAKPEQQLLHHTLGVLNYEYVQEMFEKVTVYTTTITESKTAGQEIDRAISQALKHKKPVYIEIPCNISAMLISEPTDELILTEVPTSQQSLKLAVNHAATLLNNAIKPSLIAGPKIRSFQALESFELLAKKSGYAYANQPQAKGFVNESSKQYIGTYWGAVSSPGCAEVIESGDAYLFAGPMFTDYSTTGNSIMIKDEQAIYVHPHSVIIANTIYDQINMKDFLNALSAKIEKNNASLVTYDRIRTESLPIAQPKQSDKISTKYLFSKIETLLSSTTTVIAETGDSWFNAMDLTLPTGCKFEIQMQYGSIGWCTGATLGYQCAVKEKRQVIGLTGDGSFQMTAQEVSTMLRYQLKPIIFLFNNKAYTIEVEIHDGPYNTLHEWDYTKLIDALNNQGVPCLNEEATNIGELDSIMNKIEKFDGLCFINIHLDRDDCNKNLLKWGTYVSKSNAQKPSKF